MARHDNAGAKALHATRSHIDRRLPSKRE